MKDRSAPLSPSKLYLSLQLRSEELDRAFKAAYRLLSYRPRSQAELVSRLKRRGFSYETINAVISKLKEQGLVDDNAFAAFWKESRQQFKPISSRLLQWELKNKGVPPSIIEATIASLDDEHSAYLAARKKAQKLAHTDFATFKRRLGGFLYRRGFYGQIVGDTIIKLWRELSSS